MKNLCTIMVACALGVGLTACSGSSSIVAPEGARFDGGFTVGGGHRIGADSSSATSTSSTETPADSRFDGGGYTIGSGSRAAGTETTADAPAERGGGSTIGSGGRAAEDRATVVTSFTEANTERGGHTFGGGH